MSPKKLPTPVARPLPIQLKDKPTFDDLKSEVKVFHKNEVLEKDYSFENYMSRRAPASDNRYIYTFNDNVIGREESHYYQDHEVVFNAAIVYFSVGNPAVITPYIGGYFYHKNERDEKERVPFFMTEDAFKDCGFDVGKIILENLFEKNQQTFDKHFRPKESGSVDLDDFESWPRKKVLNFCVRDVEVQGGRGRRGGEVERKRFVAGYSYSLDDDNEIITKEFAGDAYEFLDLPELRGNFENPAPVPLARGFRLTAESAEAEPADFSLTNPQNKQAFEALHHKVRFYGGGGSSKLVEGYYVTKSEEPNYIPFLMDKGDYDKFASTEFSEQEQLLPSFNLLGTEKKEFPEKQKQYFREIFQRDFQRFRDHSAYHAQKIEHQVYNVLQKQKYPHLQKGENKTKRTFSHPFKGGAYNREIREERRKASEERRSTNQTSVLYGSYFIPLKNATGKEFFIFKGGVYKRSFLEEGNEKKYKYTPLNREEMENLGVYDTLRSYGVYYEPLIYTELKLPDAPRPRAAPAPAKPSASRLVREERMRPGFGAMVTINSPEKVPGQTGHHKIRIDIDEVFPNSFAEKLGLRGKKEGRPHFIFVFVSGQDFSTEEKIKDFHEQIKQDLTAHELPADKYLTSKLVYNDGESMNYRVDLKRGGANFRPQNQNREVSRDVGRGGASLA